MVAVLGALAPVVVPAPGIGAVPRVIFIRVGHYPSAVGLYRATSTVYSANEGDNDLSVINGATCNSTTTSGCHRSFATYPTQDVGHEPSAIAVSQKLKTYFFSRVVSVIDAGKCNASNTSRCDRPVATVRVGRNPWRIAVDRATDTLYVSNYGGSSVSVIKGATCKWDALAVVAAPPRGAHRRPVRPFVLTAAAALLLSASLA